MAAALPLRCALLAVALSLAAAAPLSNAWHDLRSAPIIPTQNPDHLSATYTYVALDDNDALCLDGSHYGYFICRAGDERWEINLQGGGWFEALRKQTSNPFQKQPLER